MSPKSYGTHAERAAKIIPAIPEEPPSAEALVASLVKAKGVEAFATEHRIKCEDKVAAILESKEDGSKTTTMKDGTKVTITRGFNFKADCEAIRAMFRRLQLDHAPPVARKTTDKLDEGAYKTYAQANPAVYRKMNEYVTVTAKKTSVTITGPKA